MEEAQTNNSSYQIVCNGFLENGMSKLLALTLSIILSLLALPLIYGIIWYEKFGQDNKRTLINQLFGSICWYLITAILFLQFPVIARFMFQRSLNKVFCAIQDFIATTLYCIILGIIILSQIV